VKRAIEKQVIPRQLRVQWALALIAAAAGLGAALYLLNRGWQPGYAWPRGLLSACGLLLVFEYTRRHLHENRRADAAAVLPDLGSANIVSLARGVLAAGLAFFLGVPRPAGWIGWVPGGVFMVITGTDSLDGYLARRFDRETILGRRLDLTFDTGAALAAALLAVAYGQVPLWFSFVGALPCVFHGFLRLRRRHGFVVRELPPSGSRGVIGGFVYGFLLLSVAPVLPLRATALAGTFIALAVAASFARDGLIAMGWLDPASGAYRALRARLRSLLFLWVPVVARVFLAAAGTWFVAELSATPGIGLLAVAGTSCLLGMILLGFSGQTAAILLFGIACLDMQLRAYAATNALVLGGSLVVLLLGTGRQSVWPWEARLVARIAQPPRGRRG
jgi:CDP-diacylglycerol--glycerol-3-phosphate 3-phosphatidyltransferase